MADELNLLRLTSEVLQRGDKFTNQINLTLNSQGVDQNIKRERAEEIKKEMQSVEADILAFKKTYKRASEALSPEQLKQPP